MLLLYEKVQDSEMRLSQLYYICYTNILTSLRVFISLMTSNSRNRFKLSTSLFSCSISRTFELSFQLTRPRQRMEIMRADTLRIKFLLGLCRDLLNPCSRSEFETLKFSRKKCKKERVSSFTWPLLISLCFIFAALLSSSGNIDVIAEGIGLFGSIISSSNFVNSTRVFTYLYAFL